MVTLVLPKKWVLINEDLLEPMFLNSFMNMTFKNYYLLRMEKEKFMIHFPQQ